METTQQQKQSQQLFTCSEPGCNAELDADNLFLPELSKLAELKAEELGLKKASITLEDLPYLPLYAVCQDHRYPDDKYTLAESIASVIRYHQRRSKGNGGYHRQKKFAKANQPQATVTEAEANELVKCFCGDSTPRHKAKAPGWMGCNILQVYRHHYEGELEGVKKTPAELGQMGYITSEDLLKSGEDGLVHCAKCMPTVIEDLKQKARDFGVPEEEIAAKIQEWSVIDMIIGVRKKEQRVARNET